ncbi:uncharacterized protein LOC132921693 [Rhopalosiphum padi]|uniref:uncharacterized protein LOC132921693 n=1 Tax=Rhopalosiphum padi TaxID=40932 RepID=UPI00298DEEC6|nr:uncharacterized protein LOC132921693 [Rhopalosiphum padi]
MVSSQTLITLTVISILRCSESNKYKAALHSAGYSENFEQFSTFRVNLKKWDESIKGISHEFMDALKKKGCYKDDILMKPLGYCKYLYSTMENDFGWFAINGIIIILF